jgi:hypothetical protein
MHNEWLNGCSTHPVAELLATTMVWWKWLHFSWNLIDESPSTDALKHLRDKHNEMRRNAERSLSEHASHMQHVSSH